MALRVHKDVVDTIDALMGKPPATSGTKHIPPKPEIDHGLSEEQKALCDRGRWLQDRVNAVFSVAHSKVKDPMLEDAAQSEETQQQPLVVQLPLESEPSQDSHA